MSKSRLFKEKPKTGLIVFVETVTAEAAMDKLIRWRPS